MHFYMYVHIHIYIYNMFLIIYIICLFILCFREFSHCCCRYVARWLANAILRCRANSILRSRANAILRSRTNSSSENQGGSSGRRIRPTYAEPSLGRCGGHPLRHGRRGVDHALWPEARQAQPLEALGPLHQVRAEREHSLQC